MKNREDMLITQHSSPIINHQFSIINHRIDLMKIKIITIPFEREIEDFDSEIIENFLLNKEVKDIKSHFFTKDKPYWTFVIQYESITPKNSNKSVKERRINLNKEDMKLFEGLRSWRNELADQEGFPPYVISSNNQLKEIAQKKPNSKAKLKTIQGIGSKKVKEYGDNILQIVAEFSGGNDEG